MTKRKLIYFAVGALGLLILSVLFWENTQAVEQPTSTENSESDSELPILFFQQRV